MCSALVIGRNFQKCPGRGFQLASGFSLALGHPLHRHLTEMPVSFTHVVAALRTVGVLVLARVNSKALYILPKGISVWVKDVRFFVPCLVAGKDFAEHLATPNCGRLAWI